MGKAWIDGVPAPLDEAVAAAADRISGSRQALFTGLQTDVAGIKAVLDLARRCGGVVDHARSDILYRNLDVLRSAGMFVAVPAEMRRRADRFLVIGDEVPAELLAYVFGGTRDLGRAAPDGGGRSIVWLGGTPGASLPANGIPVETIACAPADLVDALATIRAALAGRRFNDGPIGRDKAAAVATLLGGGAFACLIWSATALDALGIEMAGGLVTDLNLTTRASSLPLGGAPEARGAAQVATAVAGFPLRVGFGRGEAEHDVFAYDGARLLAAGECDLVVHVDALGGAPIEAGHVPVIALGAGEAAWSTPPAVAFAVGVPGKDHPAILYRDEIASFVAEPGGSGGTSAAAVLAAIAAALGAAAERAA